MSTDNRGDDLVTFHGYLMHPDEVARIRANVAASPPLTVQQRERLRVLLRPMREGLQRRAELRANAGNHHADPPKPPRRNQRSYRDQT